MKVGLVKLDSRVASYNHTLLQKVGSNHNDALDNLNSNQ